MNLSHAILAGIGGLIGSVLRYWLSGVAQGWINNGFPLGTLFVNVLGCLVAGVFWSLALNREWFQPEVRVFVAVGILGGYTTFSTFGVETFMLLRDGEYMRAILNVTANVVLGLLAVVAGWMAVKLVAA